MHAKLLAALDDEVEEEKEEDVSIAELLRRERTAAREVEAQALAMVQKAEERKERERQLELELAALAKRQEEERVRAIEADKEKRALAAIAEMERKTKRFFDVDPTQRKLHIVTTGGVYFGEYEVLGDDWHPSGWGEFRLETGAVVYEGEWVRGLRHGAGTLFFDNDDLWEGTFYLDEARGLGTYRRAAVTSPETGSAVAEEREAYYHRNTRAAWKEELIPGRRVVVPSFRLANVGDAGTIVGRPADVATNPKSRTKFCVHFDLSGTKHVVDLGVIFFTIVLSSPLVHRFEHDQERELVRYDYAADAADRTRSDYHENFYRDEVVTKAKKAPAFTEANRDAFLARKAREKREAVEHMKKAELKVSLGVQAEAEKTSSAEEAAFQVEVQKQIDAKQTARRNRAQILRGAVTVEKTDAQELHDITHHHHEKDLTENIKAGV